MELVAYLSVLRRRLIPVLLCLVAGAAGGWYAGHAPPTRLPGDGRAFVTLPTRGRLRVGCPVGGPRPHHHGFVRAATAPGVEGEVFNLGCGEEVSMRDLAIRILDRMGNGGFWRSSQQEVADQFDRLLER